MDQDLLWCEDCNRSLPGDCPLHGSLLHIKDRTLPPRAILTAPAQVAIRQVRTSPDRPAVYGTFAACMIRERTSFGPVEANLVSVPLFLDEDHLLLKLFDGGIETGYLDVNSDKSCNWLIYVRPARTFSEQNMVAYQHRDSIYYVTTKSVLPDCELRVWYAADYAVLMGIPLLAKGSRDAVDSTAVSVIRSTSDPPRASPALRTENRSASNQKLTETPRPGSSSSQALNAKSSRRKCRKPQRVPQSSLGALLDIGADGREESPESDHGDQDHDLDQPESPGVGIDTTDSGEVASTAVASQLAMTSSHHNRQPFEIPLFNEALFSSASSNLQAWQRFGGRSMSPMQSPFVAYARTPTRFPLGSDSPEESMQGFSDMKSPESYSMDSESGSADPLGTSCLDCGKKLDKSESIHDHAALHSGNRPYACSYPSCNKFFSSKYKLLRHELIHSQEKRHHCPLCHKTFHRKDHLNNHLKVHERSKVRLECRLCGCIFAKKWTYEKHLALHERDQSNNSAAQISAVRTQNGFSGAEGNSSEEDHKEDRRLWMRQHANDRSELEAQVVKKVPLNQKPSHPCEVCGKVFSASKDLRRHLQTHLGIKPNLCPFCPKKFTRKDHVRRHIMTVHADCQEAAALVRPNGPPRQQPNVHVTALQDAQIMV